MAEQLHARFIKREVVTNKLKDLVNKITNQTFSDQEKTKQVYKWVVENIKYRDDFPGYQEVTPRTAEMVLESGYGDCKDQVVLLNTMLAVIGIRSSEVFLLNLNTRGLSAPKVPSEDFSHVFSYLPDLDVYLDATLTPDYADIPASDQGHMVLRTSPLTNGLTLIPTSAPEKRLINRVTSIQIKPDDSANIHFETVFGYDFYNSFYNAIKNYSEAKSNLIKYFKGRVGDNWRNNFTFLPESKSFGGYTFNYEIANIKEVLKGRTVLLHADNYPFSIIDVVNRYINSKEKNSFPCTPVLLTETTNISFSKSIDFFTLPKDFEIKENIFEYSVKSTLTNNSYQVIRKLRWQPSSTGVCEKPAASVIKKMEAIKNSLTSSI